jgi:energy-coupling factor transport system ATP-binding protein
MAIARLNKLTYWYPRSYEPALDDVELDINDGITVVAGPSGGGKSTLLRVLNGLVPHFHGGRIRGNADVDGMNIIDTPTRKLARTVGFVFQDPELQAVYDTVEHEVAFGLENIGVAAGHMSSRIYEALHDAGAEHLRDRKINTLSGGERQRVALASSLAMRPRIVVLDEPTSQLDPEGATQVLSAATRLSEQGRAVVISEHRLERLLPLAHHLIVVENARAMTITDKTWTPPSIEPATPRTTTPGAEAWSLTNVTAGFAGRIVLDHVDLSGRQGEVVALSGPNGSGKTTLLRLISGLLPPLSGHIDRRPGRIAYLPQNPTALLHRPTVRSEVELTLNRSHETDPPEKILNELGLLQVAGRYPRDLSCGERQRAALAAVLAGRPDLVLLDEPTRGMDAQARTALMHAITRLRDQGSAIVLATHDARLRDALADRVIDIANLTLTENRPETKVASR